MSKSYQDKDYHKLRNPKKYGLEPRARNAYYFQIVCTDGTWKNYYVSIPVTKEDAEKEERYNKIYAKYGCKHWVVGKRRRCNTRKSNARMSKVVRRMERAKGKEEVINLMKNEEILVD